MRYIVLLSLAAGLVWPSLAEARLFRQTYGAIVPTGDSTGCQWNVNQDYFVPRHQCTCRYGLFSPCKLSCSRSAACRSCHPLYPGYCHIYTPCRYLWRDHVYRAHCGCKPIRAYHGPWRAGSGPSCASGGYQGYAQYPLYENAIRELPQYGPVGLEVLGTIPNEQAALLGSVDFGSAEPEGNPPASLEPIEPGRPLPSLGSPRSVNFTEPLSSP